MKFKIPEAASNLIGKAKFNLDKASPDIFVVLGIVGTVVGTVVACKAAAKEPAIREEAKMRIEEVRASKPRAEAEANVYADNEPYGVINEPSQDSIRHYRKELFAAYAKSAGQYLKLFGPAAVIECASIGCILHSHNIMRGRNIALAAAYTTVDKAFKSYRTRVANEVGDEVEKKIRYGLTKEEVTEQVETESGKKKKVKKDVIGLDQNENAVGDYSPFVKFFDEASVNWDKNPDINMAFLMQEQKYANMLLRSRGYLFLNEVLERLDIPVTEIGHDAGWVYDAHDPENSMEVDFGVFNSIRIPGRANYENRRFVNGYENVAILEFNCLPNIKSTVYRPKKIFRRAV